VTFQYGWLFDEPRYTTHNPARLAKAPSPKAICAGGLGPQPEHAGVNLGLVSQRRRLRDGAFICRRSLAFNRRERASPSGNAHPLKPPLFAATGRLPCVRRRQSVRLSRPCTPLVQPTQSSNAAKCQSSALGQGRSPAFAFRPPTAGQENNANLSD
jgi:hypothetical protein